jgi:hypothetical protein
MTNKYDTQGEAIFSLPSKKSFHLLYAVHILSPIPPRRRIVINSSTASGLGVQRANQIGKDNI